jgi:hypothetical protein
MNVNKWVAVLATCSVLAVAAPVSAQFGGLGALKKKLDTVAKELEKPKPAPQPQPTAPQSSSTPSQGGYATTPANPMNAAEAPAPAVNANAKASASTSPEAPQQALIIGQQAPTNLQAGPMPNAVKSGLMKVDSCVYFEDDQGQGTTVVEFIDRQGSVDTVSIADKSIFRNIGVENLNNKSSVEYLGSTVTDYYLKITFNQGKKISVVARAVKQEFSEDPYLNFDFSGGKTAVCYLEANNIG